MGAWGLGSRIVVMVVLVRLALLEPLAGEVLLFPLEPTQM